MEHLMQRLSYFSVLTLLVVAPCLHGALTEPSQQIPAMEGGHNRKILLINIDPEKVTYSVHKEHRERHVHLYDAIEYRGDSLVLHQSQRWSHDDGYMGPYHFPPSLPDIRGGDYITNKNGPYLLIPSPSSVRTSDVLSFLGEPTVQELLGRRDYVAVAKALAQKEFASSGSSGRGKFSAFLLVGKKTLDDYAIAAPNKVLQEIIKTRGHK